MDNSIKATSKAYPTILSRMLQCLSAACAASFPLAAGCFHGLVWVQIIGSAAMVNARSRNVEMSGAVLGFLAHKVHGAGRHG